MALAVAAASAGAATSTGASTARPAAASQAPSGLAYSHASADTVQSMPKPGSCHYRGSGLYALPDPKCTPGALNPAVTQATIHQTICRPGGYTDSVRPPESVTESEKTADMRSYGNHHSLSGYEMDHFIPLDLGGAANDARNFWPEKNYPGVSPDSFTLNPKDKLEDYLRDQVCYHDLPLAKAQAAIAGSWTKAYQRYVR